MGLAEGGMTYRTYYVEGDLPDEWRENFIHRVNQYAFEPLTPEAEEDISFGWVPIDNVLATNFNTVDLYLNQYIVAALRMDRWAIPPILLKAAVRAAERNLQQETSRDRLSRTEKGEILDRERSRLKRSSLPAVRALDMCWNIDTGELRFGSLSRNVNEVFTDLFEATFNLRLIPANPYTAALQCGLDDNLIGALADVEPTQFVGGSDGFS